MKLHLNKKKLKNLSKDNQALPMDVTPQVGGGNRGNTQACDNGDLPTASPECEVNGRY